MASKPVDGQRFFEVLHVLFIVVFILLCMNSALVTIASGVGVGTNKTIVVRCAEREREALLKFKQGLVDDGDRLSSWSGGGSEEDNDCCQWQGVQCSNLTGHVISLDLRTLVSDSTSINVSLMGMISPSLLHHPSYLDLSNNDDQTSVSINSFSYPPLRGIISPSLLQLHHLSYLDLSNNDFGQSRIPDFLGSFSSLHYLSLADARFSGTIPHQIGNLTNLRILDLGGNNNDLEAKSLEWLSQLRLLRHLDLSDVDLSKIHSVQPIENLSFLTELQLSSCQLPRMTSPFLTFTNFSSMSLEFLDLSVNHINGSLPDLGQQSNLLVLQLSHNLITGTLPDLRSFPLLKVLDLSNNQLSGRLTESIGELSELETLDVSQNSFQGTISETHFKKLSKLRKLDLSFNLLAWEYNSDWVPPFQLEVIRLANCTLGPHFPKWLQTQNNFSQLDITSAGISDTVPAWFWDLSPRLNYLDMSYNKINGFVPDLSRKFVNLYLIDLRSNQFEGSLPLAPPSLNLLYLSQNMFSGSSSSLCSYSFILYLDISDNLLSGEIPDCWAPMTRRLIILNVANNKFSGRIPSSIGLLEALHTLSLRNNTFTGELPLFSIRASLKILDLSENRLSGRIPKWIGAHRTGLIVLSLRKNEFSGSIPSNLCNLQDIQLLDLSQNNLSGHLPRCFYNFTSLVQRNSAFPHIAVEVAQNGMFVQQYISNAFVQWKGQEAEYREILGLLKSIDLSDNKLVGEIPHEFYSLKQLVSLNLSRNNLTGKINQDIGQMRMLESLDLSRNQISGAIPWGLALLSYLSVLDLSNNNLSGKIPSSTQLQGFNASVYAGNHGLCGLPLPNKCPGNETTLIPSPTESTDDDDRLITLGFYVSMVLGFALGFWGVFGTILLNRMWGSAYFKLVENMTDWIYVITLVNMARLQRKLCG